MYIIDSSYDMNKFMLFHALIRDNSCTITIKCYQISFTGIYDEPSCNPNNLSHAVLLVGYGSEGDQDYWIIKNRSEKHDA